MRGPSPVSAFRSTDPAVVHVALASAQRFGRAVARAKLFGECRSTNRHNVLSVPLTHAQRFSRDAWRGRGLSAFDATMIVLQLGSHA